MADFPKSSISNINLSERNNFSRGIESFAEIVLIDKQSNQVHPTLYQLRKESIPQIIQDAPSTFTDLPKNAFLLVGDVTAIDKANRLIFLTNGDSVNYKYLVIIKENQSKGKGNDHLYNEAFKTLIEAISIRAVAHSSTLSNNPNVIEEKRALSLLQEEDLVLLTLLQTVATRRLNEKKPTLTESFYHGTLSHSNDCLFEVII